MKPSANASAAQPRPSRGEARQAAILQAARTVFLARGFEAATLDEVIALSGGSRATLYGRFGGKEGLFAAIIQDLCRAIVGPLAPGADDETGEPEAVLTAFGRRFMATLMDKEGLALYRVVIGESRRFSALGAEVYRAGPHAAAERLSQYLRQATRRGQIAVTNPDLAARHFLEMVKGDLHTRALFGAKPMPSAAEIDACVRGAVSTFLYGCAVARRRTRRSSVPSSGKRS